MKTRTSKTARPVAVHRRRFALHPLSFAICLAMSGAALALPQGGRVVNGDATISKPSPNTEVVKQTTDKAIIDWKSFSIAAGERVRFDQPSSSAVTLNRVTGYDPSYILGQMSSNGKIFLVNPYGVVFGAGARIDVGGLVVSTLSIANGDFLASRYNLTSVDPAAPVQRGAIRNEGTISAPGGTVVLAGPSVTNTGTIIANGGHVGLVAANSVSIDVEGDGLIFFQANATEAKNRLEQLGRIQADGGTIEMRAAARGAFADTVLNMAGVVQARTIGTRECRIVIDGGGEGVVHIAGTIDASGRSAGERGGSATVQGNEIVLDNGTRIDASGDVGGGAIRVGGGFHGADASVRNAANTSVASDVQLTADAVTRGDGGTVAVWADGHTTYGGYISARGGSDAGNGGFVEVSGKDTVAYQGLVDTRAPKGQAGTLLLDPTDFTIQVAGGDSGTLNNGAGTFTDVVTTPSNITPITLQTQLNLSNVIVDTTSLLAGTGTITVVDPVAWANANSLTLKADSTITVNAAASFTNTGTGGLNFFTNAGAVLNGAVALSGGSFAVADKAGAGRAASFTAGAGGTISTAGSAGRPGGSVNIQTTGAISTRAITTSGGTSAGAGNAAGNVTLNSNGGLITTNGAITAAGGAAGGVNQNGGAGGTVAITSNGLLTVNAGVATTGGAPTGAGTKGSGGSIAVQGNGVTVAAAQTLDADDNTIAVNGGGGAIQLNDSTLTTTRALAPAVTIQNATTVAVGNVNATAGTVQIGLAGDVTGAVTQTAATTIAADTLAASTSTAAGSINLGGGGATLTITNLGNVTRGGALTINDSGGGLTLSGDITGGTTANAVSITTAGGALALGAHNITTTTGAGNLTLAGDGVSQTTGALLVGGMTAVNGGTGSIDLQSNTNHFTGNVDLTATGSAAIRDAAALHLNSFSGNGITAIAGTTLSVPAGAITTTGGTIDLEALGGTLATTGTLTSNGGAITLVGATGLTVANDILSGGGPVNLTGGGAGGLVVNATRNVNAGAGTIALDGGGAVIQLNDSTLTTTNATVGAVTIHNGGTVTLGNVNAASGTMQIGLAGDVTGAVTQTAGTTLAANTLVASTSTASGSIDLGSAGTLTITNLGAVQRGGALTLVDSGGGLVLTGDVGGTAAVANTSITTAGGALDLNSHNVTTGGAANNLTFVGVGVTQTSGAVVVSGTTNVNAGSGSIALQSGNNDFTGAVTLVTSGASAAISDTNNLTLGSLAGVGATADLTAQAGAVLTLPATAFATTGSIDLRSLGGTLATNVLGPLSASSVSLTGSAGLTVASSIVATNALSLNTTNAAITQPGGTITAGGATTFNAGVGAVTLGRPNILNSIGGTGGAVSITDAGAVALDTINAASLIVDTSAAGGTVSQTALKTLTIAGATTINAGAAGTITLANAGNNFGSFGATGGAVSVADSNAIALNAITATSLNVDTSAGNGAVTQTAAFTVTNATAINAGGGSITLGSANTTGSFGATGGAVSLTGGGPIVLDNVNATSLSVDTHLVNGNVSQTPLKTLVVPGATAVNAGTGSITLANPGNNFGSVGATGGAVAITDINALALDAINATSLNVDTSAGNGALTQNAAAVVTGSTIVTTGSGATALNNAGNNFSNAPGNSFTGGAISVRDANDLTVTTLASGPNQAVSVVAGLTLTLPLGAINTGAGDLTLSAGTTLTTPGTLSGNNISLSGTGGVIIGADVNAAGNLNLTTTNTAVNQTAGKITAGGATTVTAGAGNVTLAQPLNDFNSINVVSGGIVNINDANALTAAANAGGTLTITSTGPLASGGTLSGTTVSLTGNAGITLANNVTASGTLQLASTNAPINQTAGAISATAGLTTVNAGSGDVTLNQPGNDFSNIAGISVTGGAVRLQDTNALKIVSLVNGANKDLSLTAGTTITGLAGNIDTGSADLTISAGTGFTTFGSLRGTNVTLGGGTGGVSIGTAVTALGNLTLNATNAAITQTAGGSLTAAGTTTANAGNGSISLALAGNNFTTFAATGGAINVRDDNGLALGPINATTLTLDTSVGNGAITQTGAAVVTSTTTINAGSGAVTLNNAGNDFANVGVSGGAVSITDSNALALNAVNAAGLTINTSAGNGAVTQAAGVLVVPGATSVNAGTGPVTLNAVGNDFGSFGATGGAVTVRDTNALALDAINATSLTLNTSGAVTQNAAAIVTGATTANAGASAITLNNPGNDFSSVGATGGAVAITDINALALDAINATGLAIVTSAGNGAVTQNAAAIVSGATTVNAGSGAVTLANAGNNFGSVAATGGAMTITDINALALGAINATSLTVNTNAGNGAVTQSAPAIVTGVTNVNAGTGAVTLGNAGNDFATLGVTGGAISVVDSNALALTSLTSAPNQAVSVTAGGALTLPATPIDTGAAALSLTSGGTLTTAGTLRGTNVLLSSGAAMILANNVTALGTLSLTSANAPITQTAGTIIATGTTTVNAGSGDVTLAQPGNDFQNNVALTGGAVSVRDTNNLTVSSLTSGANRPVSLIAGGTLVLPPTPIDTGTADLNLQALGGTLVINSALSGNNVTLTGSAGLTLAANITSSGDQIYTTPIQLAGNVTLNSGASRIDLQGGANGGGNNLALTSSNAAANAIHTGAPITNTAQLTVTGNSTLGGNVTTTGSQTYTGTVALGSNVTLDAGAAKIDLHGAVDAAGNNLALTSSNAAADAIRTEAAITNAAQLTVTGKSTFSSGVSTTGAQLYSDTVTLGSSSNFSGSSLGFGNGIVAGAFDLGLRADTLNLAGAIAGSGNATLSSETQSATIGVAGGAGLLQLTQATLDRFASFGTLTVGRADGSGDLTFGNLVLPTNVAIQSASGNANFTGTVSSAAAQSRDLSVSTGGTTTFAGAVGGAIGGPAALGNLNVTGATNLNASSTTNGAQSFGGPVTVGADTTLSASTASFGNTLDVGAHTITLFTDALSIAGAATGTGAGSVQLAPKNATGSIGVAGAAGGLQVSQGLLNTLAGVPTLALGRVDSTGTVTVGNVALPGDLAVANGSGNVAFTGTVDSAAGPARNLAVTTTGMTSFAGAVGATRPVGTLTVSGASQLGSNVASSGAQTFTGSATLVADSTLAGPSVSFGSTVDGAHSLTVNAAATHFGAAIGGTTALTSLTTDAAGATQLGGNVTTTGTQTYNDALSLNADAVLSGTTLTLAGKVDGAQALALNGSTGVTLAQAIGTTTPLAGINVTGPLQLNAGTVTTTGAQSYAGVTTLGAATSLTAPSIAFGNTLDGPFALTLQSAGPTSFAGAVGATVPLASLTANGGGAVQLTGPSIETSGAQSYSGALQLGGSARLTGSALTLGGPVSGATDLTLQTNALNGATSISGTGTLSIAPIDPTLSIGVAGGAG
ncbi:MAG TPA: filamentous hemagglutinin N-terminal domain-containing protein, partial [Caldimonas sp.]|nr:filamentous hemagglutinin N-terminal domain-containing protein [Caldimonas sp.]